jgi:pimeloyl-ACP methyl ester carboxylesterase
MQLASSFDWAQIDELGRVQAAITAPVKLIWGAADPYFPLAPAREMQRELGWEMDVLPGKLFVHEERADDFARIASAHLERCFGADRDARAA